MAGIVVSASQVALQLAWAMGKLGWAATTLGRSRRRAIAGFRRGLAEMGVPPKAIRELVKAYPRLGMPSPARHQPPADSHRAFNTRPGAL